MIGWQDADRVTRILTMALQGKLGALFVSTVIGMFIVARTEAVVAERRKIADRLRSEAKRGGRDRKELVRIADELTERA